MNTIGISVDFQKKDVRGYKFENCSLVTSIFTLQFMILERIDLMYYKIFTMD